MLYLLSVLSEIILTLRPLYVIEIESTIFMVNNTSDTPGNCSFFHLLPTPTIDCKCRTIIDDHTHYLEYCGVG